MLDELRKAYKQAEKEFNELFGGAWSCIIGLKTSGKHLFKPTVTLHYPDQHWVMYKDTRNWLKLMKNEETGEELCTACGSCVKVCPCSCINIAPGKKAEHRKGLIPDIFEIDFSLCCFCGLCVEACPFHAIKFCAAYEMAQYNRKDLVWNKEQLLAIKDDFKQTEPKQMVDRYVIP